MRMYKRCKEQDKGKMTEEMCVLSLLKTLGCVNLWNERDTE